MNEEERRQRILSWLEAIEKEARRLAINFYIFNEVKGIIGNNQRLQNTGSDFFRWMEDNFVVTAAVAVRRQADERKDVISMKRFLKELCRHPHLASRDHYVGLLAKNPNYPLDFAHKQYDHLVGGGRSPGSVRPPRVSRNRVGRGHHNAWD